MKKHLLLASLFLAPAALCAATFEGKVSFKMTSAEAGKPQELQYSIKGDKIRVDIPGQSAVGGMIIDMGKKEMTTIMEGQKMYMVMAMPDVNDMKSKGRNEEVKLEKTGETEKILGYTAEKYISTYDGTETELWLAEGLGSFALVNNRNPMGGRRGRGAAPQGWERALAGKDLFPLRVVGRDKSGKEGFRMETTAIDKQSLPDSLFTPPADYQKLDMGGMMKGMMKGMIPGMKR